MFIPRDLCCSQLWSEKLHSFFLKDSGNAEIHNLSNVLRRCDYECPVPGVPSTPTTNLLQPKAQGLWWKGRQKECKIQMIMMKAMRCWLLAMARLLHTWTCTFCGHLHKIRQVKFQHRWEHWLPSLIPKREPLAVEAWWQRESHCLDGVTTGRLTMSQEMAPYLSIYGQHELDVWIIDFLKRHEVGRSYIGDSWRGCWKEIIGDGYNSNTLYNVCNFQRMKNILTFEIHHSKG